MSISGTYVGDEPQNSQVVEEELNHWNPNQPSQATFDTGPGIDTAPATAASSLTTAIPKAPTWGSVPAA